MRSTSTGAAHEGPDARKTNLSVELWVVRKFLHTAQIPTGLPL